jgi:hypothetical protein
MIVSGLSGEFWGVLEEVLPCDNAEEARAYSVDLSHICGITSVEAENNLFSMVSI